MLALALSGGVLVGCGTDDDKAAPQDGQSSPAHDRNQDKARQTVAPSTEELTAMLLDSGEVPSGYEAQDERKPDRHWSDETHVTPDKCQAVIDHSFGSGATADIERVYRGSDGVTVVNLIGLGHGELVERVGAHTDTLRGCGSFHEANGNDWWDYRISEVRTGTHGPDSVSWRVDYISEGELAAYEHHVLTVKDSIGIEVTVQTEPEKGKPNAPTALVDAQLKKIDAADWTGG